MGNNFMHKYILGEIYFLLTLAALSAHNLSYRIRGGDYCCHGVLKASGVGGGGGS
jgi:hypothetical protein